jgi:hypothetical protein
MHASKQMLFVPLVQNKTKSDKWGGVDLALYDFQEINFIHDIN